MDSADATFQSTDAVFQVGSGEPAAGRGDGLPESLICIPCRPGDATLEEARMMARIYWNTPAPHWAQCFERIHIAWLLAILFVLCGCINAPPPAHVRVDVSQQGPIIEPIRPPQLTAPAPRLPQTTPEERSPEADPPPPTLRAPVELAPEPAPIAFGEVTLPHVLGPFNGEAAINDPAAAGLREVGPVAELPAASSSAAEPEGEPIASDVAMLPAAVPAPEWQSLGGPASPRHLPPIAQPIVEDDPEFAEARAEPKPVAKKPKGFPWFTIGALMIAVGAVVYQHFRKVTDGSQTVAKKAASPAPRADSSVAPAPAVAAAPAAPDVNPVGVASGPGPGGTP
jgi:hypothetical protein